MIKHPPSSLPVELGVSIPYDHQYVFNLKIKEPNDEVVGGRGAINLPYKQRWMMPLLRELKQALKSFGFLWEWDNYHMYLTVWHGDIHSKKDVKWQAGPNGSGRQIEVFWCDSYGLEFLIGDLPDLEDYDKAYHRGDLRSAITTTDPFKWYLTTSRAVRRTTPLLLDMCSTVKGNKNKHKRTFVKLVLSRNEIPPIRF